MIWKRFEAKLDQLRRMQEFIQEACGPLADDPTFRARLELVAEEVLVNIISYAYPEGPGSIEIGVECEPHQHLTLSIHDEGVPFNPLEREEDSRKNISLEEHPIGGWGIGLCREIMDEVSYVHQDGLNQLTFKLNLRSA